MTAVSHWKQGLDNRTVLDGQFHCCGCYSIFIQRPKMYRMIISTAGKHARLRHGANCADATFLASLARSFRRLAGFLLFDQSFEMNGDIKVHAYRCIDVHDGDRIPLPSVSHNNVFVVIQFQKARIIHLFVTRQESGSGGMAWSEKPFSAQIQKRLRYKTSMATGWLCG